MYHVERVKEWYNRYKGGCTSVLSSMGVSFQHSNSRYGWVVYTQIDVPTNCWQQLGVQNIVMAGEASRARNI